MEIIPRPDISNICEHLISHPKNEAFFFRDKKILEFIISQWKKIWQIFPFLCCQMQSGESLNYPFI